MGKAFYLIPSVYGHEEGFLLLAVGILFLAWGLIIVRVKYDLLHPAVIFTGGVTACCGLDLVVASAWDLPFHFNTSMVILGMAFLFVMGTWSASLVVPDRRAGKLNEKIEVLPLQRKVYLGCLVICGVIVCLNFKEFLDIAHRLTTTNSLGGMLLAITDGQAHEKFRFSKVFTYGGLLVKGIAYIALTEIWRNLFAKAYRECLKWGSLVLFYPMTVIITGGRQAFLYLVIFAVVSFLLVWRRSNGHAEENVKKELRIVGIGVIAFFFFFIGLGLWNGKIANLGATLRVLAHYGGTNISALDVYLNQILLYAPENEYIGGCTLNSGYSILRKLGMDLPEYTGYIRSFVDFGYITTNVYTSFYRYIVDYGFIGCGIISFLIGYIYTLAYRAIYYFGMKDWMILVYSSSVFPIFLMGREERFFNEVTTTQQTFLWIVLIIGSILLNKWNQKQGEKYEVG